MKWFYKMCGATVRFVIRIYVAVIADNVFKWITNKKRTIEDVVLLDYMTSWLVLFVELKNVLLE